MFLDRANTQPKSVVRAVLLTRSKDVHQIKIPSQSQAQASTKLTVIRLLTMAQLASVRVRGQTYTRPINSLNVFNGVPTRTSNL